MVNLPGKVVVGGQIYNVIYPYIFGDDPEFGGMHFGWELVIKIADTIEGRKVRDENVKVTFIHELLHAIDFIYFNEVIDSDEGIIEVLSSGLFHIFHDNKISVMPESFKIPKSIKAYGKNYRVKFPAKFPDSIPDRIISCCPITGDIKIAKYTPDGESIGVTFLGSLALYMMVWIIRDTMHLSEQFNKIGLNEKVLSFALYQVFKDNKIEELIKA